MEVMNEYIALKASNRKITFRLSPVAYMIELSRQFNGEAMKHKVGVKPELLRLSIYELIERFDIRDLATYLVLNHVYIYKNNQAIEVNLEHKGKRVRFMMTKKEQRDVLCCKTKRRDELVKMSFKFMRRRILKEFENTQKGLSKKARKTAWKKRFFAEFLEGDATGIKYFEFFDLSKKRLQVLKKFPKLVAKLKRFQEDRFIAEMVAEYIVPNPHGIADEGLGLDRFLSVLTSRQHKHSMVIQHILNALREFCIFFKF